MQLDDRPLRWEPGPSRRIAKSPRPAWRPWLAAAMVCLLLAVGEAAALSGERFGGSLLSAAPLPQPGSFLAVGPLGELGQLEIGEETARYRSIASGTDEDLVSTLSLEGGQVLIGTSGGRILLFQDDEVAALAELANEPILDLRGEGATVFAVGGRGLVARSRDAGRTWQRLTPERVRQPPLRLPSPAAGSWSLGVANIDEASFQLVARVDGSPVQPERDYSLSAVDGRLDILRNLDPEPWPTVIFDFAPGAPFQAGDSTWNVVLLHEGTVTIAGEFGLVLQTHDQGVTWERRFPVVDPGGEPRLPYWIHGASRGERIVLVGAAGVVAASSDGGLGWDALPKPGDDAIFGASLLTDGTPVVAGAVGLVGMLRDDGWQMADRSDLRLFSWLKTVLRVDESTVLVMGGRGTLVRWNGGRWQRLPIERAQGDG